MGNWDCLDHPPGDTVGCPETNHDNHTKTDGRPDACAPGASRRAERDPKKIAPTLEALAADVPNSPGGAKVWYGHAPAPHDKPLYSDSLYGAPVLAMLHKATGDQQYLDILWRGAWTSLFMQSPFGELPTGYRNSHHIWNEAEQAVIFEIYASAYAKSGLGNLR